MRALFAALLATLLSGALAGQPFVAPANASPPAPTHPVPVLAYYYIWYEPSSWDRAKIDYPSSGRYSSDDPAVIRQQIQQAKSAGITGFLVSWKSTEALNRRLATLADIARSEHFTLSIIYQGLDFHRNPLPVQTVRDDLSWFTEKYGADPVFNSGFQRPLVIWSGTWRFTREDFADVAQAVRPRVLLLGSEKSAQDYQKISDLADGDAYYWSSVDPERDAGAAAKLSAMSSAIHAHNGLWIAPFSSGFDARKIGGSRVVDRREGETMRQTYGAAASSSPDALGLISWNEYSENSEVEPSVLYGDRYLNVLREITGATTRAPGGADDSSDGGGSGMLWPLLGAGGVVVLLGVGAGIAGYRRSTKDSTR